MEKIARADDYNFCLSLSLGQVGDCTRHLVIHRFGVEKDQQLERTWSLCGSKGVGGYPCAGAPMRTSGECQLLDTSENIALSIPFALSIYSLAIYGPRIDMLV